MAHKDRRREEHEEHRQPAAETQQVPPPKPGEGPKVGDSWTERETARITASNDNGERITLVCIYKPSPNAENQEKVPDKVKGFFNTLDSAANAALR